MTFTSPVNTTWWRRLTSPQWRWLLLLAGGAVLILTAWLGFRKVPTTTFDLTRHSVPLDQLVDGREAHTDIPGTYDLEGMAPAHPSTIVLSTRTGSFRNYDRDP